MRAQEFLAESQQATAKQVLSYINRTHHEPFEPGSKMYQAVMAHPRWELVQVPLLNLNIPDQEYDDVDYDEYEPESDPYGRVMTVEPEHAGEVSAHLVDKKPIVIDTDRYIIDGNHRAWAAKHLLNHDYIQAWRPIEQLQEYRQGPMELLRKELPGWPDYVIKDMIYKKINTPGDLANKIEHVRELAKEARSWRLVQKMPLTFDMLDSDTQSRMKQRKFGDANPFKVPNDRDRFEHALRLVQEKSIENLPPVIFRQTPQGLELWEGWHRTMAAFRLNPKGFKINAWIGTP
jgi:hypothetical protein